MKLSSGAKRDLLIVNLAFGMIMTSTDDIAKADDGIITRDNKDYKLSKRINRRLEKLAQRLQETQNKIFRKYEDSNRSLGKWVRGKLDKNFIKAIHEVGNNASLELVAHQMLYINFCERDKPLIEEMQWLQHAELYDELYDLLDKTAASKAQKPFEMAYNAMKKITE